jgi:hypothetical protein
MNDNDPTVEFQCALNTFEWEPCTPCIWLCHWVRTVQKHRKDGLSLLAPHCYVRVAAGVTGVLAISEWLCSIAQASR